MGPEHHEADRRKFVRVGFATHVEIIFNAGAEQTVIEASSQDLSQKGVFAKTHERFPRDTPCDVRVYLTGSVEQMFLEIQGKVIRCTDSGIGIVFESMDVDVFTHLKNIVRYNSDEH